MSFVSRHPREYAQPAMPPDLTSPEPGPTAGPAPALAATSGADPAIIGFDQPCLCSYNLRGLPSTGTCPECNRPIADSLPRFPLIASTGKYRAALVRGLSFVFGGVVLAVTSIITGVVLVAIGHAPPDWMSFIAFWLAQTAMLAGYWLYTTPDSLFAGRREPVLSRRVLPIAAVAWLALLTAGPIAAVIVELMPEDFDDVTTVVGLYAAVASTIGFVVHFFAMMHYTQWTVERIPHHAWARRIRRYAWLVPVLAAVPFPVLFLIASAALAIAEPRESTIVTVLFITSGVGLGFILAATLMFVHMIFVVRRLIQRLDRPRA